MRTIDPVKQERRSKQILQKGENRARKWGYWLHFFHRIKPGRWGEAHRCVKVLNEFNKVVEVKCRCGKSFFKKPNRSAPLGFSKQTVPTFSRNPFQL